MPKTWVLTCLLVAASVFACSPRDSGACYGLSDSEALRNVMRDYYAEPATAPSGPASQQMRLSRERLIGVGRSNYAKGRDNVIQLWFLQDDGTLTVASYFEDCDLTFSPNNTRSSMVNAAYAVKPPRDR